MSEIKVNSIKGVGASAAAITVNNSDGTCTANITNNLSNRNLIINGAMQVAQRGTSSTSDGYQTVDRFPLYYDDISNSPTQAQVDVASGTTPYSLGFRKAFKITNGDQTIGADDRLRVQYAIEAQDVATSGWNYTSASSYVTLSFWIKTSVEQNFFFRVMTLDGTMQNYVMETGTLTADTWTKITKTIPGNSNLQFDNDNGEGLRLDFGPFYGTNFTGTRPLNAWAAYDGATRFPDFPTTWFDTNDATLEITGVQLEVSDHATDFEHRSFGQELALCERYCQTLVTGQQYFGTCMLYTSSTHTVGMVWKTSMRASPSIVANSGGDYYITYRNGGQSTYSALAGMSLVSANGGGVYTTSGSGTQGHAGAMGGANASTLVYLSAEL